MESTDELGCLQLPILFYLRSTHHSEDLWSALAVLLPVFHLVAVAPQVAAASLQAVAAVLVALAAGAPEGGNLASNP